VAFSLEPAFYQAVRQIYPKRTLHDASFFFPPPPSKSGTGGSPLGMCGNGGSRTGGSFLPSLLTPYSRLLLPSFKSPLSSSGRKTAISPPPPKCNFLPRHPFFFPSNNEACLSAPPLFTAQIRCVTFSVSFVGTGLPLEPVSILFQMPHS